MSGITVSGSTETISNVTYAIRKPGESEDTTLTGKLYYFAPGEALNRKISWTGQLPEYTAYIFAAAGGGGGSSSASNDYPGYGGGGGAYLISDITDMNVLNNPGQMSIIFTKIGSGGQTNIDGQDTIITTNNTTNSPGELLSTYTLGKGSAGSSAGSGSGGQLSTGHVNFPQTAHGSGGNGGSGFYGAGSPGGEGYYISVNSSSKILFSAGGGGGASDSNDGGNGGGGGNSSGGGGAGGTDASVAGGIGQLSLGITLPGNSSFGGDGFFEDNTANSGVITTNGGGGGGAGYGGGGGGSAKFNPYVFATDTLAGGAGADGAVFVFVVSQPPTAITNVTLLSNTVTSSAFNISFSGGQGDNVSISATATDGSNNVITGSHNNGTISFTGMQPNMIYEILIRATNGVSPDATWGPSNQDTTGNYFSTAQAFPPSTLGYNTSNITSSGIIVYYTGGTGDDVTITATATNSTDSSLTIGSVDQAASSVTFSSLTPLTTYSIAITAVNSEGDVTLAPFNITTKPPTPQNKVTFFSKTSSQIVVTINPVTSEGINATLYKAPKFYITVGNNAYYLSTGSTTLNQTNGTYTHTITQANSGSGMSNLTANTTYNIKWALVANSDDESALSPALEVTTSVQALAPAAPQNTVTRIYISPTEIRVKGDTALEPVATYTDAKFYISTSDGPYILGTGSNSLVNGAFIHTISADPGTEYKIKWTLITDGGESPQSEFFSVTTPTQAPVNPIVFISKTATQIEVRADARDESGGFSNYINAFFYISTKTSGNFGPYVKDTTGPTNANSPDEGQYTHIFTVSPGSIHTITWTFVTDGGESSQSPASEVITTLPSAPNIAAEFISKTSNSIRVFANTNGQSGGPFTNVWFYIFFGNNGYILDQNGTTVGEDPTGIYTYEFSPSVIYPATEHSIKWALENNGGEGALSETLDLKVTTPAAAPPVLIYSSKSRNTIVVTGNSNGHTGEPFSAAKFYISSDGGNTYDVSNGPTSPSAGIYTHAFTGLTASVTYYLKWSLINNAGESDLSNSINIETNGEVPSNLPQVNITSVTSTTIIVNGESSSATYGPFTGGATFYISSDGGNNYTAGTTSGPSGTIYTGSFTVSSGGSYRVRWTLTNDSGESLPSVTRNITTPPSAPSTVPVLVSSSSTQAIVTGNSGSQSGGPFTSASFYISSDNGVNYNISNGTTTGPDNNDIFTHTFTVIPGNTYIIKWSLSNIGGESALSEPSFALTITPVPLGVPNPVFVSSTTTQIVVTGNSSSVSDGPFTSTSAKFYLSTNGGAFSEDTIGSTTYDSGTGIYTHTFGSLTAGTSYSITWTLSNAGGESAQSTALTKYTKPSAPDAAIFSSKTSSQIVVTGTSAIATGAKFYIATPLVASGAYIEDTTVDSTTYDSVNGVYTHTFTSLTASRAYTVKWTLFNPDGESAQSVATEPITTDAGGAVPSGVPKPVFVSSTTTQIVVTGNSSSVSDGPFTSTSAKFYLSTNGGAFSEDTTANSTTYNSGTGIYTHTFGFATPLTPGTSYSITWTLTNGTGESNATDTIIIRFTIPLAPALSSKTSSQIVVTGASSTALVNGVSGAKFFIATPLVSSGAYIEDTTGSTTYNSGTGTYTHTFTSLTASRAYTVKWTVFNAVSESQQSAASASITTEAAGAIPSKPPTPLLVSSTSTSITVTGNSSSVTGSPFTDVTFYIGLAGSDLVPEASALFVPINGVYTYTFSGLNSSTSYDIAWTLTNATGPSLQSFLLYASTVRDNGSTASPNSIRINSGISLSGVTSYVSAVHEGADGTLARFTNTETPGSIDFIKPPNAGEMIIWAVAGGGIGGAGHGSGGGGGGGSGGSFISGTDLGSEIISLSAISPISITVGASGALTKVQSSFSENDVAILSTAPGAAGNAGTNSAGGKGAGGSKGGNGATASTAAATGTAALSEIGGGGGGGGFSGNVSGAAGGAGIIYTFERIIGGTETFQFSAGGSGGSTTQNGTTVSAYGCGGGGGAGNAISNGQSGTAGAVFIWLAGIVPQPTLGLASSNVTISDTGFTVTYTGDTSADIIFYGNATAIIPKSFSAFGAYSSSSVTVTGTSTSATFTGLSPGTSYIITITASSPSGSTTSAPINITTTGSSNPICFLRGSKILCLNEGLKEEYIAIENMRVGTPVKTLKGTYIKVHTIGKTIFENPDNADRGPNRLFKLTPQRYPELTEDLIITGCHSILVDKLLPRQKARHLQLMKDLYMTTGKFRLMAFIDENAEPYLSAGKHEIWHFALENPEVVCNYGVYANGGLLVETASIKTMTERGGLVPIE